MTVRERVASQTPSGARASGRGRGHKPSLSKSAAREKGHEEGQRRFGAADVAAYVRVSSASQSHEMQLHAIEHAARARGDRIAQLFVDTASSRKPLPHREAMLGAARRGSLRRVYVYRLDRLSRNGIRETIGIVEDLRRWGVELVTVADGFELGGPAEGVVLAVLAWAANMERDAIAERIRAARARIEAAGGSWGRPPRLSTVEIDKIRKLARKGRTIRSIAMAVGAPRATVGRCLRNLRLVAEQNGSDSLAKGGRDR